MRGCQLLRAAAQVMAATSVATSGLYSDAVVHDAGRRQLACVPVAPHTQRTCARIQHISWLDDADGSRATDALEVSVQ